MIKRVLPFVFLFLLLVGTAKAADAKKIYQIGYFEGGDYYLHKLFLDELRKNLELRGSDSLGIQFYPQGYFSAEWDRAKCKRMARDLASRKDIDVVVAAGPWVVEDLLEAGCKIPIVGVYQFDPEVMGLVDSTGKPKAKNLTVIYRPNKIKSDLAVLHRLFPQRRLGLLYFPSGDEFDKMKDKVYRLAEGMPVSAAREVSGKGLYSFFLSLAKVKGTSNILYLPSLYGMDLDQTRQFLYETQNAKMPTFVADGYLFLEKDATLGNTLRPHKGMARFAADKILKIRTGAEPDTLPTKFDDIELLCLNLEAANKLGITFSRIDIINAKVIPAQPGDTMTTYTLPDAVQQALRENAGFLASGQTYDRAVAAARNVYRSFYPEIGVTAAVAGTDEGPLASKYNDFLQRRFQTIVDADQTIFSYSALKGIQIARKNLEIEKIDLQSAEFDLRQAVITAYAAVLENEEKVSAMYEVVDRLMDLRDNTEAGVRIGQADKDDLPLIEARLVDAKVQFFELQKEKQVAKAVFNNLINRPANFNFILDRTEFSPETMVLMVRKYNDYVSDAKKERKLEQFLVDFGMKNFPGIKQIDYAVGIQNDLISQNKWRYLPELHFRAGYSYGREFSPAVSDNHDYWTFGGILSLPLFGGTKTPATKALKADLEAYSYRKDSLRMSRVEEIVTRLQELTARLTTLPLHYFSRNLSVTSLEASRDRFDSNRMSAVDLITIEEKNASLAVRTVTDRYNFFRAYIDLLGSVGVGYLFHGSSEETSFYKGLEESIK